ncbi:MAG: hypothetical protein U0236_09710 [Nitrospira sp.]
MRRVDFYFHDGCLSQLAIRLLAKEIETAYPTWTVTVHPLLATEVIVKGIKVLPAVAINGALIYFGIPSKDWLLETVRTCDQ